MGSYDRKTKEALKYFIFIFLNEMIGFSFGNALSRELSFSGAFKRLKKREMEIFRGLNDVIHLNQARVFPSMF